jgi:hypothetical protein
LGQAAAAKRKTSETPKAVELSTLKLNSALKFVVVEISKSQAAADQRGRQVVEHDEAQSALVETSKHKVALLAQWSSKSNFTLAIELYVVL